MNSTTELISDRAATRLFNGDYTLWSQSPDEIANRLDWLTEPRRMQAEIANLVEFANRAREDGCDRVVWCGMGGSSLFPELLATSRIIGADHPEFLVLDSSHPAAVQDAHAFASEGRALFVIASKSGATIETRSHLEYFWHHFGDPAQFAVVTDAGSALDSFANEHGFRHAFHANPNIGGRYSALSHFGLVAAGLLGIDVAALLQGAVAMLAECASDSPENPGLALGAAVGEWATTGRDKLILDCNPALAAWLEQLIAESTGKQHRGILPVPGDATDAIGADRVRVSYGRGGDIDLGPDATTRDASALGRELIRWEIATAIASVTIGINPFDQPDVEAAKLAAAKNLERPMTVGAISLEEAIAGVAAPHYVAVQAFVDPAGSVAEGLPSLRRKIRDSTGCATTATIGPRYLHSTGQFHKGGTDLGVFVQLVDTELEALAIPGRSFGFDDLLRAQAIGDANALVERGRKVARVAT